jgi:hypothetical protein
MSALKEIILKGMIAGQTICANDSDLPTNLLTNASLTPSYESRVARTNQRFPAVD